MARLVVFGLGYLGRALARRLSGAGWEVLGTGRPPAGPGRLAFDGAPADPALAEAVAGADAVISMIPPDADGDPAARAFAPLLALRPSVWIGYVSTTGVYGDLGGRWAFEWTPPNPTSPEAARRVLAEGQWRALQPGAAVFRLPAIYGPGRSALDRARAGQESVATRPGLVFSRAHVEDLAEGIALALERRAGGVFNLTDDMPSPPEAAAAVAAELLGLPRPRPVPLAEAGLSPAAARFYQDSRRVSNARAKAALGWRPRHPTLAAGLAAILAAEEDAGA